MNTTFTSFTVFVIVVAESSSDEDGVWGEDDEVECEAVGALAPGEVSPVAEPEEGGSLLLTAGSDGAAVRGGAGAGA
ncbi:MAG TPA: hypothetical protein VK513_16080 [Terriglobales bacterium]|nr:hypothetical protein [Terriglobales bacterium]